MLKNLLEQVDGDENDVDMFGMDPNTRKRLKVKMRFKRGKVLRRPVNTKMPYSLSKVTKFHREDETRSLVANSVALLREVRRQFVTPGKEGRGKHDPVGIVLGKFIKAVPEFGRSIESKDKRPNGWTLTGSWPTSGKHVFDWEMDVWGERGGDVIVKTNLWGAKGGREGIVYRVTLGNVDKSLERWIRKFYRPVRSKLTAKVREESVSLRQRGYLVEAKRKKKKKRKKSPLAKFLEKHGVKSVPNRMGVGCSEREQKCYGYSHRAIVGFGMGNKVFQRRFGNENTLFVKHGKKTIRNMADARKAATAFARYVS